MRLIYKPFGIVMGILSGLVAKKLFDVIWGIFDNEEPPKPTTQETTWPRVLAAAAVEGITFKVVRAAVDRSGAKGFNWITGIWPGEKHAGKSQAGEVVRYAAGSPPAGPRITNPRRSSPSRSSSKAAKSRASR